MSASLRMASTVDELAKAVPIEVGSVSVQFDVDDRQFTESMASVQHAMTSLSTTITTTVQIASKVLRKYLGDVVHPQTAAAGYRIVNRRGRNKLIDVKRVRS